MAESIFDLQFGPWSGTAVAKESETRRKPLIELNRAKWLFLPFVEGLTGSRIEV